MCRAEVLVVHTCLASEFKILSDGEGVVVELSSILSMQANSTGKTRGSAAGCARRQNSLLDDPQHVNESFGYTIQYSTKQHVIVI